eukprot:5075802-Prymnesium_polylepis.2
MPAFGALSSQGVTKLCLGAPVLSLADGRALILPDRRALSLSDVLPRSLFDGRSLPLSNGRALPLADGRALCLDEASPDTRAVISAGLSMYPAPPRNKAKCNWTATSQSLKLRHTF